MVEHKHWTEASIEDFRYKVAYDFVNQVEFLMQDQVLRQADLAAKLGVTPGRVSQFFSNPGNMSLKSMVEWARALGQKVAVVLYDDGDARNVRGPVHSEVFRMCWVGLGMPSEVSELNDNNLNTPYRATTDCLQWPGAAGSGIKRYASFDPVGNSGKSHRDGQSVEAVRELSFAA